MNCAYVVLFKDFAVLLTLFPPRGFKIDAPFSRYAISRNCIQPFPPSVADFSSSEHRPPQSSRICQDVRFLFSNIPCLHCVSPALYIEEQKYLRLAICEIRSFSLRQGARMWGISWHHQFDDALRAAPPVVP